MLVHFLHNVIRILPSLGHVPKVALAVYFWKYNRGYTLRVAPTGNDMSVGVRELDVRESKSLAN